MKILFLALLSLNAYSTEMICKKLELTFNENGAKKDVEFFVDGCFNPHNLFIISKNCKNKPEFCLKDREKNIVQHPGGEFGSPAFIQCYRVGGKPRFVKLKIGNNWEDTSTCFLGSKESFMDYDSISNSKELSGKK